MRKVTYGLIFLLSAIIIVEVYYYTSLALGNKSMSSMSDASSQQTTPQSQYILPTPVAEEDLAIPVGLRKDIENRLSIMKKGNIDKLELITKYSGTVTEINNQEQVLQRYDFSKETMIERRYKLILTLQGKDEKTNQYFFTEEDMSNMTVTHAEKENSSIDDIRIGSAVAIELIEDLTTGKQVISLKIS